MRRWMRLETLAVVGIWIVFCRAVHNYLSLLPLLSDVSYARERHLKNFHSFNDKTISSYNELNTQLHGLLHDYSTQNALPFVYQAKTIDDFFDSLEKMISVDFRVDEDIRTIKVDDLVVWDSPDSVWSFKGILTYVSNTYNLHYVVHEEDGLWVDVWRPLSR